MPIKKDFLVFFLFFFFQSPTAKEHEYELPLMLDEIHEESHEDDDESARYHRSRKSFTKYSHSSSTL